MNFLIKIINLLKEGGKALVIIPDGILESPSLSPLRAWLIRQCHVDKIVGLPKFVFAPYTKEKTYALFITKRGAPLDDAAKATDEEMWFYIVDNDGYANSDKRFPTGRKDDDGRWLHDELSDWTATENGEDHDCALIERWQHRVQPAGERYFDEWGEEISGKKYGRIKVAEVLRQAYASYETVPKSAALKTVQVALTPVLCDVSEECLKRAGVFVSSNKKTGKVYEAIVRSNRRTITEPAALKMVIATLKGDGTIPSIVDDLFSEEDGIKTEFAGALENLQIVWDDEDLQFYDRSKMKVVKLMNLLPEKYLREQQIERVPIIDLRAEIDQIDADFKALLLELTTSAGVRP